MKYGYLVNVAAFVDDETIRKELYLSSRIRDETLRRCLMIPSYKYKSLVWKNRYYEVIQKRVKAELINAPI